MRHPIKYMFNYNLPFHTHIKENYFVLIYDISHNLRSHFFNYPYYLSLFYAYAHFNFLKLRNIFLLSL